MSNESYILTLDSMIASKEAIIERLDKAIAEKTRKANSIKEEVQGSEQVFITTLRQQREISNKEVGQVRKQVDDFKRSTKLFIDDLTQKDKELQSREARLEGEKKELVVLRAQADRDKASAEALIEEAMELMQKATFVEKTATLTDEQVTAKLEHAKEVSQKLASRIKEWMTFEKERSTLLDERQKRLDLELGMAVVEKNGYLKAKQEILKERKAIESQWQQLLSAKKFLDGERSKPCPTCTLRK